MELDWETNISRLNKTFRNILFHQFWNYILQYILNHSQWIIFCIWFYKNKNNRNQQNVNVINPLRIYAADHISLLNGRKAITVYFLSHQIPEFSDLEEMVFPQRTKPLITLQATTILDLLYGSILHIDFYTTKTK